MKRCCDCKYYVKIMAQGDALVARCAYGNALETHMVDGYEYYRDDLYVPWPTRNDPNKCGVQAAWYKRKWWKFWRAK